MFNEVETVQHIFLKCHIVQKFWAALDLLPAIQLIAQLNDNAWIRKCQNLNIPSIHDLIAWKDAFPFYI